MEFDEEKNKLLTDSYLENMDKDFEKGKKEIIGDALQDDGFNIWFRLLKIYVKGRKNVKKSMAREILEKTDKREIIIFKVNPFKLNKLEIEVKNKKTFFPFHNIFFEYPLFINKKPVVGFSRGIFFKKTGNKVIASSIWEFHNYFNREVNLKVTHIGFKEEQIYKLREEFEEGETVYSEDNFSWAGLNKKHLLEIIKKFMVAIEKKEYTTYRKWNPSGYITKEIVYAYDVRAHKRHFWDDTGYFKIPSLSKEELKEKNYDIDELVFKDGELRKDVPFIIIGIYKVGKDKLPKEENREIFLLEKRIFRQEEKLLKILKEIFPDKFIKRHDRKILKGLELDFLIRELRLAFEYDGEQHFDEKLCEEVFKSDFEDLKRRDRLKNKLCRKRKITLIRIKYDEPLTKSYIKKKIKQKCQLL